ncbi:MAG TPA: spore coat protein U domain-containing protein [Sphingobium sp.]
MKRLIALLAVLLLGCVPVMAGACTSTSNVTTDFGTFSPQSVKQSAVPAQVSRAGLSCQPSVIVLLGINYIRAKFKSDNGLKLVQGANAIPYVASPDAAATVAFTQNGTVDYMQNNLLNILGLLGGSNADMPIYIKPSSGTLPPVGVYTDRITITWDWYLCPGVNVAIICIGTPDYGIATTVIDVKLTVGPKTVQLTTSTGTTWDPVNGTLYPKSLPGGRRRMAVEVFNPDLVAVDTNTLGLNLAIPAKTSVALDGDGTASSAFLLFTDGSPASSLAITYTSPSSSSDDVDFSSDNGATWTYVPVSGNDTSQAAVTNIRVRPRGAMAASSRFTLSVSLKVR